MERAKDAKGNIIPTYLEYQFLLMAQRILLDRSDDPTVGLYNFVKSIHANKKDLGLEELLADFIAKLPVEKKAEELINSGDAQTLNAIKQKATKLYQAIGQRLEQIKTNLEEVGIAALPKSGLETNIEFLAEALQFNPQQRKLLMFFACSEICAPQELVAAALGSDKTETLQDLAKGLALILDEKDHKKLQKELEEDSVLVGMNFLSQKKGSIDFGVDMTLFRFIRRQFKSAGELLTTLLGPNPKTDLTVDDYKYMADDLNAMYQTLHGYLSNPSTTRRKNMIISGVPGTGKTEVTALLGKKLGVPVFLVGTAEKSSNTGFSLEEPKREDRIRALVRAAFILRQTKMRAILVLDEAEDILTDLKREESKETGSKAFVNDLLEHLGVSTIFISNKVDLFDPASIRRLLPFYAMNYIPLSARINSIIKKTKIYTGLELSQHDAHYLSKLGEALSIAAIDSCIQVCAQRGIDTQPRLFKAIQEEFNRAIRAQTGGIAPLPVRAVFKLDQVDTELFSASEDITELAGYMRDPKANYAGKDFVVLGDPGTGRQTIAQYLASATGYEPRIINLSQGFLEQYPKIAHSGDLEQAALDKTPIVFIGCTGFLLNSRGHPFLEHVRAHPLPTFFVCDTPHEINASPTNKTPSVETNSLQNAFQHMTFFIRTGYLEGDRLERAYKNILLLEDPQSAMKDFTQLAIGEVFLAQRQLQTMGKLGDPTATLSRLKAVCSRFREGRGQGGFGFAQTIPGVERFSR